MKISEVMKSIVTRTAGVNEIVCLYEEESTLKTYQNKLYDIVDPKELKQHSATVSWGHLSSFVKKNKAQSDCNELNIPSSCGVNVTLEAAQVKRFMDDGIGILGINQCEQLENETDQEKQDELVKEHTMNFVTGGNPTWDIFMLSKPVKSQMSSKMPNCLVERVQTKRIQEKIKDMGNIDKKSVAMANILHNPGAGATTIGKDVLWNLKEQFRCAYLDGDVIKDVPMKKLSEMILLFRKIKEKDSKATGIEGPGCKTVFLFVDNTSFEYVKTPQRNLDQVVETEKIKYNKTIVILLYAERSANLDIERCSDYDSPNIFKVESQLDKKEQKSFSVKLGLLDKTNIPP